MQSNKVEGTLINANKLKIDFNPKPIEKYDGVKIEGTDFKKVVATRDFARGELIGEFQPIAVFYCKNVSSDPRLFWRILANLLDLEMKKVIITDLSGSLNLWTMISQLWPRGDLIMNKFSLGERIRKNSFGGERNGMCLLYNIPSFINHSCASNSLFHDHNGVLVAFSPIKAGDEITICYSQRDTVEERRAHLVSGYGFTCKCSLCESKGRYNSWFEKEFRKCGRCSREGSKWCLGCHMSFYCSKECQTKHWKIHKHVCKKVNLTQ